MAPNGPSGRALLRQGRHGRLESSAGSGKTEQSTAAPSPFRCKACVQACCLVAKAAKVGHAAPQHPTSPAQMALEDCRGARQFSATARANMERLATQCQTYAGSAPARFSATARPLLAQTRCRARGRGKGRLGLAMAGVRALVFGSGEMASHATIKTAPEPNWRTRDLHVHSGVTGTPINSPLCVRRPRHCDHDYEKASYSRIVPYLNSSPAIQYPDSLDSYYLFY